MNKAIFLDRDGTLIKLSFNKETETIDTVNNPDEVTLTPDISEVLKKLKSLGYLLTIVSNQPRVGIKKLTLKTYNVIKKKVDEEFKKESIVFDAEYYCMHHPWADIPEYRVKCDCRKPGIKFFKDAKEKFDLDMSKCYMVGDGVNDVLAGHAAGTKTILIANLLESAYLTILEEKLKGVKPDFIIKKPKELLDIITT